VTPAPAPAPAAREAPRNWQLLDPATDRVPGIGAERAQRELLAGRKPRRTVVVAVIDGGVDTAHVDLKANLWTNPKEVAGNRKDDDRNGYVDDVRGWNFIGGPDGRDVDRDTYELTRLHVRCTRAGDGTGGGPLPPDEQQQCPGIAIEFEKERSEAEQTLRQVQNVDMVMARVVPLLKAEAGTDSLTVERVTALQPTNPQAQQARAIYLQLATNGITPEVVDEYKTEFAARLEYSLNPSFDPRDIVGDDYTDLSERRYGNTDVMGPDAKHGTHVAGIIAAVRGNGVGVDGIAPAVRVMAVRAVPNGDERDKDVANAIRYAVDNGANIINMSFGKAYSPQKAVVDQAVQYADSRGVLMVLPDAGLPVGGAGAELDRGRRVVVEGGGQPRRALLQLRARAGGRLRPGRGHPLHRSGRGVRPRERHEHGRAGGERPRRPDHGLLPRPHRRRREAHHPRLRHAPPRPAGDPAGLEERPGALRHAVGDGRHRQRLRGAAHGREGGGGEAVALDRRRRRRFRVGARGRRVSPRSASSRRLCVPPSLPSSSWPRLPRPDDGDVRPSSSSGTPFGAAPGAARAASHILVVPPPPGAAAPVARA
jgi:hypothetical protein